MTMNYPVSQQKTWCLTHQLPEDQVSPYGLVCECCKKQLSQNPPQGKVHRYWERQPGAFSLHQLPYYVHVMVWKNYAIRSLHMIGTGRGPKPPLTKQQVEEMLKPANSDLESIADLLKQRGLIADITCTEKDSTELQFTLPEEEFEFDLGSDGFKFEPPREYDPHEQDEDLD